MTGQFRESQAVQRVEEKKDFSQVEDDYEIPHSLGAFYHLHVVIIAVTIYLRRELTRLDEPRISRILPAELQHHRVTLEAALEAHEMRLDKLLDILKPGSDVALWFVLLEHQSPLVDVVVHLIPVDELVQVSERRNVGVVQSYAGLLIGVIALLVMSVRIILT